MTLAEENIDLFVAVINCATHGRNRARQEWTKSGNCSVEASTEIGGMNLRVRYVFDKPVGKLSTEAYLETINPFDLKAAFKKDKPLIKDYPSRIMIFGNNWIATVHCQNSRAKSGRLEDVWREGVFMSHIGARSLVIYRPSIINPDDFKREAVMLKMFNVV